MENLCLAGITSTVMTRQQEKCTARFLTVVKKKLRWPLKLQVRLLRGENVRSLIICSGDSAFVTSHFDCFNIKKVKNADEPSVAFICDKYPKVFLILDI